MVITDIDITTTYLIPHAHVAGVQPLVGVEHLGRLVLVLEVALEHNRTLKADLALAFGHKVVHLGHVDQLDRDRVQWHAHVARGEVAGQGDGRGGRRLGLSISFEDLRPTNQPIDRCVFAKHSKRN